MNGGLDPELDESNEITVSSKIRLGLLDRLKAMLGWPIRVIVVVAVDGRVRSYRVRRTALSVSKPQAGD